MATTRLGTASLIGECAESVIRAPNARGSVLAVMSQAAYLQSSKGELLWLCPSILAAHPRSVLGSFELSRLQVGMPFHGDGTYLEFQPGGMMDARFMLDLRRAAVWKPTPIVRAARPKTVWTRVVQLLARLESLPYGESWAQILPLISAIAKCDATVTVSPSNAFVASALPIIQELAYACLSQETRCIAAAASRLIGMGTGLTPSGDDFVGGLIFVAFQLNAAYRSEFDWDFRSVQALLDCARTRTNLISWTLLDDNAHGQGAEPLHELVAGLLAARSPGRVGARVRRLMQIGHTTGLDLLAGALTGFLLAHNLQR